MYRLMVSFSKDEFKGVCLVSPKEYLLSNSEEVCKVITSLSPLNPIITLCQVHVFTSDDVLKDFEYQQV